MRGLAQALAVGLLAGLAVFLADALLAWLTLGYPVPVRPYFVAWYLAAGAVIALVVAVAARLFRRAIGAPELFAVTAALAYAPASPPPPPAPPCGSRRCAASGERCRGSCSRRSPRRWAWRSTAT